MKIENLKVLIAEDDVPSEQLVSIAISPICKEILRSTNGLETVDICRKNPDIDVVIMDIQMPEMNGYEATKLIRGFNKEVIIIAQTAFALAGDREKAIAAGCNDYIAKPIKGKELRLLIEKHLEENKT